MLNKLPFIAALAMLAVMLAARAWAADAPVEVSPDCRQADAAVVSKLQPIRVRQGVGMTLPLGDVLENLSRARALCRAGRSGPAMVVYMRLSDALSNAAAIQARSVKR